MSEFVEYKGFDVPKRCVGCPRLDSLLEEAQIDISLARADDEEFAKEVDTLRLNMLRLYNLYGVVPDDVKYFETVEPSGLGVIESQMHTRSLLMSLARRCKGYRKSSLLSTNKGCSSPNS